MIVSLIIISGGYVVMSNNRELYGIPYVITDGESEVYIECCSRIFGETTGLILPEKEFKILSTVNNNIKYYYCIVDLTKTRKMMENFILVPMLDILDKNNTRVGDTTRNILEYYLSI